LTLCKELVEKTVPERIWMKSIIGKGTTFAFTISNNFDREPYFEGEGFFMKKICINLGIMWVTLGLCVFSFEVIIRAFQLAPDVFLQPDSDTGVWHIPNKQGVYFRKDVPPVKIKINSQGLRDYEYPLFRPERDYRIAIVGDSFSEAFQVLLDDTFYQLLETRLNATRQTRRFDVINFGVGGFGTVHEYLAFHQYVFAYHPNMVLLQFMLGNDILDNSPILNGRQYLPYFTCFVSSDC
jgi:hypothetical protein